MDSNENTKPGRATADDAISDPDKPFDFSSSYSHNFPGLLKGLNISLAVTSYQSQRLFFVRSDGESIDTHFKAMPRPMGIYADSERLTVGTFAQVLEFKRSDEILHSIKAGALDDVGKMTKKVLEKDQERMRELMERRTRELNAVKQADALYLSRAALTTGMINIHDIAWGTEGLWVVNSTFSCLATLSPEHSFVARWKPPFIKELVPEDRCHLNGMGLKDGRPKYVTTFNQCNERDSWTNKENHNGTLIDVDSNEILLDSLLLPHSPRYYRGKVYVCDSGRGLVLAYDPTSGQINEVIKLQGFTRGLAFYGPLMFVGLSRVRVSGNRVPLPITEEYDETLSGVWVVNLADCREIGYMLFSGDVTQLYDIAVVPDATFPELIGVDDSLIRHTFDFAQEMSHGS